VGYIKISKTKNKGVISPSRKEGSSFGTSAWTPPSKILKDFIITLDEKEDEKESQPRKKYNPKQIKMALKKILSKKK
jgi:hypothetical protein